MVDICKMKRSLLKINREIFNLALPNVISNISVPLISSVDTALMGHLSSTHLGAVGIGAMLFNFLYWNFGFLRMGTTGMIAQAYGANRPADIMINLLRALWVGLVVAGILLLFQSPISYLGLELLNTPDTHLELADRYFRIRIWAAPATFALYVFMGWYFGMQNAIFPLILTILINATNIVLSYYLVVHLSWDIEGVAWGTLIAQYTGLAGALGLWWVRYSKYAPFFKPQGFWRWSAFRSFLHLNSNIFIRTLCLSFAFAFFYNRSSAYGPLVLDANVVLLQFLNWMSYGVDGFAYAAESLIGKYKGAKDKFRFDLALQWNFIWGAVLAGIYALVYFTAGEEIIDIFTDIEKVREASRTYLSWMVVLPIAGFASYIWDGVFVGITAGKAMRNSMLASLLVFLLAYALVPFHWGNHGLWFSMMVFLLARALFQWFLYRRKSWALT
jgi:MATE family multidrug resistance protein